jgi:hypothetical protein
MTYTTKASAIAALSAFSLDKLNELLRLSDMIFVPDSDQLLNVTFTQMVDKAHALADIHFPEWTDRSKSDFGEFVVELMALFSEKDFLYANSFGLESFIEKATKYSTIYIYATTRCGYEPKLCRGTTHAVAISYVNEDKQYLMGDIVFRDTQGYTLSLGQNFTTQYPSGTSTLKFIGGEYTTVVGVYTGRGFRVNKKNINFDDITCLVNGTTYQRVSTFSFSQASDKHFIAVPEIDGTIEVFFGRNGFGVTPDVGSELTIGVFFNCSPDSANIIGPLSLVSDVQGSVQFSNYLQNTFLGQSQETISALRRAAIAHFRTQGNIINKYDVVDALLEYSDVTKATAIAFSNTFTYYIVQKVGVVESELITYLDAQLATFNIIEGFAIGGAATDYIVPLLDITVYTLPGYPKLEAEASVKSWLEEYTDPRVLAEYGKDFVLTDVLVGLVSEISGVQNVVFNTVQGITPADISVGPTQILEKIDWGNPSNVITVV